jgi:hypothetical protein
MLTIFSAATLEQFDGFPISISVQPYKQEAFSSDSMNSITKVSDKVIDGDGELYSISLIIRARDVYGNIMYNDNICTYFLHSRFVVYHNFVIDDAVIAPGTLTSLDLANKVTYLNLMTMYVNETFDVYTGYKTFKIIAYRPPTVSFTKIKLNYTLIDGLNYKNGILVKYYSNNNHIGKPLYMARIPTSFIGGDERQSYWHEMH